MTEEKTCYNCGNKNCNVYYSMVKKNSERHYETYEYRDFDCVNHNKWEELKVEEIRTDNTETLKNALERIAELEEKTSVLLSCENCPENKDGLICQKEYENKCLAQKIQYIKELKEEIAELKSRDCWKSCEYASPKAELIEQHIKDVQNLTRAKEIIKELLDTQNRLDPYRDIFKARILKAEQFLKECQDDR